MRLYGDCQHESGHLQIKRLLSLKQKNRFHPRTSWFSFTHGNTSLISSPASNHVVYRLWLINRENCSNKQLCNHSWHCWNSLQNQTQDMQHMHYFVLQLSAHPRSKSRRFFRKRGLKITGPASRTFSATNPKGLFLKRAPGWFSMVQFTISLMLHWTTVTFSSHIRMSRNVRLPKCGVLCCENLDLNWVMSQQRFFNKWKHSQL